MAVRGEEVAGSIDARVRESVERLVAEIRSSVEDVRAAVDSQLKAALQSVQADVNSISFLPDIRKSINELQESFEADRPAPAAAAGSNASRVKQAVQQIERGKSQVDILNALLEQCLEFGSRAALLILRGETFSGWKGLGFSRHGGNDEMVKRFNAAPGLLPQLDDVLRNEHVVIWDGANLATRLGVAGSDRAVLVPMVIKDKVAAAVYVDAVGDDVAKLDGSAVELVVFATGLLIDTLAIRKKVPSPSLQEAGEASATAGAPSATASAAPPTAAETAGGETVAVSAQQLREMMAAARPSFNMPSADDFSAPAAAPAPPPRPAAPAPAPAAPAAPPPVAAAPAAPAANPAATLRTPSVEMPMPKGVGEERASTQFIPPPGLARGGVLNTPQNEDAKKHDEARRFARLLVSEIKLYNEAKVDQGRKNRDLYERLKEDIDRSRQMYDERITEDVRKSSNYFYDELVRILADGKSDALGL